MTAADPSKLSMSAFLQVFATKMLYLRISGVKTMYLQTLVQIHENMDAQYLLHKNVIDFRILHFIYISVSVITYLKSI